MHLFALTKIEINEENKAFLLNLYWFQIEG